MEHRKKHSRRLLLTGGLSIPFGGMNMIKVLGAIAVIIQEVTNSPALRAAITAMKKIIGGLFSSPPVYNSVYHSIERTNITHAR